MLPEVNIPLIELLQAGVEFRGERKVRGISFNVCRGEFIMLQGSTGSGKTLALELIAGIKRASFGQVLVAGECINDFSERQMMFVRRSMGIMMPECGLLENRTILENVMLPAIASEASYREAHDRALKALSDCDITDLAKLYPHHLSQGQRQIACLARAIVNRPVVVLADEPCAHLDAQNAQKLIDLLGNVSLSSVAVIVASHLELMPSHVACRTINLDAML